MAQEGREMGGTIYKGLRWETCSLRISLCKKLCRSKSQTACRETKSYGSKYDKSKRLI